MEYKKINIFNIEAEQMVLGTIILNNEYIGKIIEFLKKEDFYESIHQRIFEYILHTVQNINIVADSITLKNFFDNDELIKKVGGSKYLSILLSMGAGVVDIVDYAKIIQDLSLKRKLINISKNTILKIHKNNNKFKASKHIQDAVDNIFNIKNNISKSKITHFSNNFTEELNEQKNCIEDEKYKYTDLIDTGFLNFDNKYKGIGGLHKKELIILAGRPSIGKSTLAIQIALNVINKNNVVLFFSLEMSKKSIIQKMLSNKGKINSSRIRYRNLSKEEYKKNLINFESISKYKLYLDDNSKIDCNYIENCIKRILQKEKKIDLIIIDHIQLMKPCEKNLSRHLQLHNITNNLKSISKYFNCCVLALCQLSRNLSYRDNKIPNLEDLRESGSIEENANMVIFIYRQIYYLRWTLDNLDKKRSDFETRKSILKGEIIERERWCDLYIKKNRNGKVGKVELDFYAEYSLVKDRKDKIISWKK